MNSTKTVHYSRSFSGFIWKIKPDPVHDLLWIEVRDEQEMSVSVFKLKVAAASIEQVEFKTEFSWWDNILLGFGDILVINQLTKQTKPGPGTLLVHQLSTGNQLSALQEVQVTAIETEVVHYIVTRPDGQKQTESLDLSQWVKKPLIPKSTVNIPSVYPEGHQYHALVLSFLRAQNIDSEGPVCYFESTNNIIISYHQKKSQQPSRHILWLKSGNIYLHRKIDQQMKGFTHESFLIFGAYMIFIVDRKHLEVHNLSS